jgi:hypothetical protein
VLIQAPGSVAVRPQLDQSARFRGRVEMVKLDQTLSCRTRAQSSTERFECPMFDPEEDEQLQHQHSSTRKTRLGIELGITLLSETKLWDRVHITLQRAEASLAAAAHLSRLLALGSHRTVTLRAYLHVGGGGALEVSPTVKRRHPSTSTCLLRQATPSSSKEGDICQQCRFQGWT